MAIIQMIFVGVPRTVVHDTYDYPLILQFGDKKRYEEAVWVVPSHPGRIPTRKLSEIRIEAGPLSVLIDGPEGFRSGPHTTDWVRSYYPRGKHCAFLRMDPESHTMGGVTITVTEETLFVEEMSQSGTRWRGRLLGA